MMQNSIFIAKSYFVQMPLRTPKIPRKRFVKYYQDLYALFGEKLEYSTLCSGSQYSYTELGDCILKKCMQDKSLENLDLMIIVAWAYEFDPDYASAGAYFANQYQLTGKMIDVSDQGTLSFFTAINLLTNYLKTNQTNKAFILGLEQTSIPGNHSADILPLYDAGCGLLLTKGNIQIDQDTKYEILSSGIEKEQTITNIILNKCNEHSIAIKNLKLVCKNNSNIYYQYQQSNLDLSDEAISIIPNYPGFFPLVAYLHGLSGCHETTEFLLIVDKDTETSDIGYLILRKNK